MGRWERRRRRRSIDRGYLGQRSWFRSLARRRVRDYPRDRLDALHHALVAVRPLPAVPLDSVGEADFLLWLVDLVSPEHPPAHATDWCLFLMHLLLTRFAIAERRTCAAGEDEWELAKGFRKMGTEEGI